MGIRNECNATRPKALRWGLPETLGQCRRAPTGQGTQPPARDTKHHVDYPRKTLPGTENPTTPPWHEGHQGRPHQTWSTRSHPDGQTTPERHQKQKSKPYQNYSPRQYTPTDHRHDQRHTKPGCKHPTKTIAQRRAPACCVPTKKMMRGNKRVRPEA